MQKLILPTLTPLSRDHAQELAMDAPKDTRHPQANPTVFIPDISQHWQISWMSLTSAGNPARHSRHFR
jgi:hypothetical protein